MNLQAKSFALRKTVLDIVYRAGTGHIGGDFSVIDILNVLYNQQMNVSPQNFSNSQRDRFVLSKGHAVEALYAVLSDRGFFPAGDLLTCSCLGSRYIGHPTNKVAGIEVNSGSLGHGLPVAAGMALAAKMSGASYRAYTVMGDGELAEGSVWEGAMFASHYKLDNLVAVVDRNGLQISGTTEYVMAHEDLAARWCSFGWNVLQARGNDVQELCQAFDNVKKMQNGKPSVILAHTTKGCGVSFMENQPGWHHRVPTEQEYKQAMIELSAKEAEAVANQ